MRFFFYGTLLDDEIRRIVVGRAVAITGATLMGWRRLAAAGKHYPFIQADAAASVEGAVTDRLGTRDIARLRHYEGEGYELIAAEVRERGGAHIAAQVFVPSEGRLIGAGEWNLSDWQREHRAGVLGRLGAYRWPQD
jgi:gamma-glutamylcyclotransferase (GGCT)/AIG2-like uncharacterized protein YtfP